MTTTCVNCNETLRLSPLTDPLFFTGKFSQDDITVWQSLKDLVSQCGPNVPVEHYIDQKKGNLCRFCIELLQVSYQVRSDFIKRGHPQGQVAIALRRKAPKRQGIRRGKGKGKKPGPGPLSKKFGLKPCRVVLQKLEHLEVPVSLAFMDGLQARVKEEPANFDDELYDEDYMNDDPESLEANSFGNGNGTDANNGLPNANHPNLSVLQQEENSKFDFKCSTCMKSFQLKAYLIGHEIAEHLPLADGPKPFSCNICDYSTKWRFTLNRHLLLHTDEKPFQCPVLNCGYRTHRNDGVPRHLRTDHNEYEYNTAGPSWWLSSSLSTTASVSQTCRTSPRVEASVSPHTPDTPVTDHRTLTVSQLIERVESNTTFPCSEVGCQRSFEFKALLFTHIEADHHKQNMPPYVCPLCSTSHKEKRDFSDHLFIHTMENRLRCAACGFTTFNRGLIYRHCRLCALEIQRARALEIQKTQRQAKLAQNDSNLCPVCGESFAVYSDYVEHMNAHPPATFKCLVSQCDAAFLTQSDLDKHMGCVHNVL